MFIKKMLLILSTACILITLIIFSDVAVLGVKKGIVISGNVIIPSLFPFTVFVLMLIKSGINVKNKFINKITNKFFGLSFNNFFVFVLSMIGGYPIGARLITELYDNDMIDKKAANTMLAYCINAGPAFIISAVGGNVFNSKKIGVILFAAHIFSSIILAVLLSKSIRTSGTAVCKYNVTTASQIFTESVAGASATILQICSYIILFSCIIALSEYFFNTIPILNRLVYLLEVTTAVTKTDNVLLVSFLLGFSGLSIWFQIFSIAKSIEINYLKFILSRLLHGGLSTIFTYITLKFFKINISVFSNNIFTVRQSTYSGQTVALSMLFMVTVLLIFIYSKNSSRKLINDVI